MSSVFRKFWEQMLLPIVDPVACLIQPAATQPRESSAQLLARLEDQFRLDLKNLSPGDRKTWHRGDGLDFSELREYVPGDDLRKMDWSVFARTNTPHIREYHEETQAVYWLVIDMTASLQIAQYANRSSKASMVRELTALLGLLTLKDHFKVGGIIIGEERRKSHPYTSASFQVFPPSSNVQSLHSLLKQLEVYVSAFQNVSSVKSEENREKSKTIWDDPFSRVEKLIHRGHHVFLISDFLNLPFYSGLSSLSNQDDWSAGMDERLSKALLSLGRLSQKAQVSSFFVVDPLEKEGLPETRFPISLSDPETMDSALWPTNTQFRKQYQETVQRMHDSLISALSRFGVCLEVSTAEEPLEILHRFCFQARFAAPA